MQFVLSMMIFNKSTYDSNLASVSLSELFRKTTLMYIMETINITSVSIFTFFVVYT